MTQLSQPAVQIHYEQANSAKAKQFLQMIIHNSPSPFQPPASRQRSIRPSANL